jgi:hypothetical protein
MRDRLLKPLGALVSIKLQESLTQMILSFMIPMVIINPDLN